MIINKDCLEALKEIPDNSIDAICTDPPYGLSFMGKKWDYDVPSQEIWTECLRVLKPGGYLLAFAGTRTQHRMAVRIEDAGFEIRDMIAWIYGSGFPKSLNIGKAVDKLQGNEREVVGEKRTPDGKTWSERRPNGDITGYAGNGAEQKENTQGIETKGTSPWEGWGTALKPALEPITVARKPIEGNVAENCLKYGTGGINIDGSRVESTEFSKDLGTKRSQSDDYVFKSFDENTRRSGSGASSPLGRFPANLIHDGSEEVLELFPDTKSGGRNIKSNHTHWGSGSINADISNLDNQGSAARFFMTCKYTNLERKEAGAVNGEPKRFLYQAKASKSERNMGLDGFEDKVVNKMGSFGDQTEVEQSDGANRKGDKGSAIMKNYHPTVKPIKLMEYLINLVSKEGHTVLDPFAGSGTTGIACKKLNREFIGIEKDEEYCKIAEARINSVQPKLL